MTATVAEALTYDGAVEAHVARSTGTLVVLYDLRNGGDWIAQEEDEGGRWMISCDDHSTLLSHTTRALARSWMSAPEQWCEDCQRSARTDLCDECKDADHDACSLDPTCSCCRTTIEQM